MINMIDSKYFEKTFPKPYLGLMMKRYLLWRGTLKPLIIACTLGGIAHLFIQDVNGSTFVRVVSSLVLYWLCAFVLNFLKLMSIRVHYNIKPEEALEILRTMFPNAEEKK